MTRFLSGICRLLAGVALVCWSTGATFAQDYPTGPIHLIIGYNPGGSVDIVSRLLAERLSEELGQQVVVENKPGGGTVIASEAVARAKPDGYTLMNADIAHGANPALQSSLPYDTVKDFTPVSLLIHFPAVLVVNKSSPIQSVQELVELARSKPGELNYSSSGVGSLNFLGTELFKAQNDLDIAHIPYKSGGEAMTALLGEFVDMLITTAPPVKPHIDKVRVLAVSADRRLDSLPDVPTFAEVGFPEFSVQLWQGFLAPTGVDPAIVERLNQALVKVINTPAVHARITDLGGNVVGSSPEAFAQFINAEIARWQEVVTPEMRPN